MTVAVLFVTRETGPDRRWGLGRSLLPLIDGLRARGDEVRYFCQDDLTPAQLAARERWLAKVNGWLGANTALKAMVRAWIERLQVGALAGRLALEQGFSHVHAQDPWIAAGVWHGLGASRYRIRWGVTQHGFGSYGAAVEADGLKQNRFTRWLCRRIEAMVLQRADFVIAPTRSCLEQLARDLEVARVPSHWHAVPHAKPNFEARTPQSRAAARQALGWSDDDFVVVALGRIVPLKRFDLLVEACARVASPRLKLVILGEGETQPLQALAASRGFGGQLEMKPVDDVQPYLQGADLYASTSASESFGLATLEALTCGLPAVCTAVGGVPEVVGDAAWLLPPDAAAFASAIAAMMSDESTRTAWSERALARTAAWPGASEITQRYVAIYEARKR